MKKSIASLVQVTAFIAGCSAHLAVKDGGKGAFCDGAGVQRTECEQRFEDCRQSLAEHERVRAEEIANHQGDINDLVRAQVVFGCEKNPDSRNCKFIPPSIKALERDRNNWINAKFGCN